MAPPRLSTTPFCVITMKAPSVACAWTVWVMSVLDATPTAVAPPVSMDAVPAAATDPVVLTVLRQDADDLVETGVRRGLTEVDDERILDALLVLADL